MKHVLAYILGLITLPVVAYAIAYSGHFPVATASSPIPLESSLAHAALHYRSHREAPRQVPVQADDASLTVAAKLYHTECAFCHGLPNQPKTHAADGMYPPPPQFFVDISDDPAGVTFWRIKNGIRLTGMPGFGSSLSDDQIWQEALMLRRADHLPVSAQTELAPPAGILALPSMPAAHPR